MGLSQNNVDYLPEVILNLGLQMVNISLRQPLIQKEKEAP